LLAPDNDVEDQPRDPDEHVEAQALLRRVGLDQPGSIDPDKYYRPAKPKA
jgi:hypothetical protein